MVDISRIPVTAISSVRGIGVADMANTSTVVRSFLSDSFCSTPKRCSSSTMTRPRSLKTTSCESKRWVPIITSALPFTVSSRIIFVSFALLKRERPTTLMGNPAYRSAKVFVCCWTRSVVGTRTATCFPSCTALKAARIAISVFPYPTSPQIMRSIGYGRSISCFTSSMVESWSGVSIYENASSSSRCQGVSGENAKPGALVRAAYSRMSSPAIALTALRARPLAFCHSPLPIRCTVGDSPPIYLLTCSNESVGTKIRSPG